MAIPAEGVKLSGSHKFREELQMDRFSGDTR